MAKQKWFFFLSALATVILIGIFGIEILEQIGRAFGQIIRS